MNLNTQSIQNQSALRQVRRVMNIELFAVSTLLIIPLQSVGTIAVTWVSPWNLHQNVELCLLGLPLWEFIKPTNLFVYQYYDSFHLLAGLQYFMSVLI